MGSADAPRRGLLAEESHVTSGPDTGQRPDVRDRALWLTARWPSGGCEPVFPRTALSGPARHPIQARASRQTSVTGPAADGSPATAAVETLASSSKRSQGRAHSPSASNASAEPLPIRFFCTHSMQLRARSLLPRLSQALHHNDPGFKKVVGKQQLFYKKNSHLEARRISGEAQ